MLRARRLAFPARARGVSSNLMLKLTCACRAADLYNIRSQGGKRIAGGQLSCAVEGDILLQSGAEIFFRERRERIGNVQYIPPGHIVLQ